MSEGQTTDLGDGRCMSSARGWVEISPGRLSCRARPDTCPLTSPGRPTRLPKHALSQEGLRRALSLHPSALGTGDPGWPPAQSPQGSPSFPPWAHGSPSSHITLVFPSACISVFYPFPSSVFSVCEFFRDKVRTFFHISVTGASYYSLKKKKITPWSREWSVTQPGLMKNMPSVKQTKERTLSRREGSISNSQPETPGS